MLQFEHEPRESRSVEFSIIIILHFFINLFIIYYIIYFLFFVNSSASGVSASRR